MERYTVSRDGELDISFTGELVSQVDNKREMSSRWNRIEIYRIKSEKYIVCKQVLDNTWGNKSDAGVFEVLSGIVDFLREEDDGYLTDLAKLSLKEAEKVDKFFAGATTIEVN